MRSPMAPELKRRPKQFTLSEQEWVAISRLAEHFRMSRSQVVGEMAERFLSALTHEPPPPGPLDRFRDLLGSKSPTANETR